MQLNLEIKIRQKLKLFFSRLETGADDIRAEVFYDAFEMMILQYP